MRPEKWAIDVAALPGNLKGDVNGHSSVSQHSCLRMCYRLSVFPQADMVETNSQCDVLIDDGPGLRMA